MIPLKDIIPNRTRPVVTLAILGLNAVVFLFQSTLGAEGHATFIARYGLIPADAAVLAALSSMFIHTGVLPLAGNLLYLWIFGDNVEDRLGHARFGFFYLLCGAAAALAQLVLEPDSRVPMVGASGAIAGVMGAYFVLYPTSRVLTLLPFPVTLVEVPAVFFLGLWFVVHFLSGLGAFGPLGSGARGLAFWAQVLGLVAGAVFCLLLRRPERARVEWWSP